MFLNIDSDGTRVEADRRVLFTLQGQFCTLMAGFTVCIEH